MFKRTSISFLVLFALSAILAPPLQAGQGSDRIEVKDGQILFEFTGQVMSPGATSEQYGYFTYVAGVDDLFTGVPANEGSARLTFFREATNVLVSINGSLKVIMREGTTTVYAAVSAADFTNPDSFRSGTPVLTSTFRQQVVYDPTLGNFNVVNQETITDTDSFTINGHRYQIGKRGDVYRTTKTGISDPNAASFLGFFGGYSVGANR